MGGVLPEPPLPQPTIAPKSAAIARKGILQRRARNGDCPLEGRTIALLVIVRDALCTGELYHRFQISTDQIGLHSGHIGASKASVSRTEVFGLNTSLWVRD